jgi:transposase
MSLRPQLPLPPVPADTVRIARAAFRRGNPYVLLRDRLGAVFADADFADLYPALGQPAYATWRLALVTLLQFREGLSDREAVRGRIYWKYLLALELVDAGFDHSVLCEFRGRLLENGAAERLLTRVLETAREDGLLRARGRQRTDSTRVLAAIRTLNRLELVGETLRAALNAIATAAPEWLRTVAPADWHERYDQRVESIRLPEAAAKRHAYALQVGADGYALLDALDRPDTPAALQALPTVAVLRRVWARHYERVAPAAGGPGDGGGTAVRQRALRTRGRDDRVQSPYDPDARFRGRRGREWVGYLVHLTETCDEGAPRLLVHADTTEASVHEAMRVEAIHTALAAKGLAPSEHLADAAYMSAELLVAARERHGIDLVGPQRRNPAWQSKDDRAFDTTDFTVDWERQVVRCPEGKASTSWKVYSRPGRARGRPRVHARFHPWTAGPVRRGSAARARRQQGASCPSSLSASTRRWRRHGRGSALPITAAATPSGKVSRPPCRKLCALSDCARPAIAAWSRPGCSTSPPPQLSILTGSPLGSPNARSHRPALRASLLHALRSCEVVCTLG